MRSGNLAGSNWAVKENEGQKRDGEKIGLFLLDCLPFLFLFLFLQITMKFLIQKIIARYQVF